MRKPTPKKHGAPPKKAMAASSDEMKWKAQEALHTLRRAEEIKKDPELMSHVHHHARGERDHLNKIIRRKVPT